MRAWPQQAQVQVACQAEPCHYLYLWTVSLPNGRQPHYHEPVEKWKQHLWPEQRLARRRAGCYGSSPCLLLTTTKPHIQAFGRNNDTKLTHGNSIYGVIINGCCIRMGSPTASAFCPFHFDLPGAFKRFPLFCIVPGFLTENTVCI